VAAAAPEPRRVGVPAVRQRRSLVEKVVEMRAPLQEAMNFLGAMASGIEAAVGEPANGITYVAGKHLGRRFAADAERTDDLLESLEQVRSVLAAHNCLWDFEVFKAKDKQQAVATTEAGDEEVMLVFRDCMIRQSLFCFGHAQKGSLCTMMFGFFAGALERIMGRASTLEIVHAGENACLKKLTVKPRGAT
jgi:predicted hydrocarbon binding protein